MRESSADEARVDALVRELGQATDPREFQALLCAQLAALAGAAAAVYFDRTADAFVAVAASTPAALPAGAAFPTSGRLARWLRINDEPFIAADQPDILAYLTAPERTQLSSMAAIAALALIRARAVLGLVVLTGPGPRRLASLTPITALVREAAVVADTIARQYEARQRLEAAARTQQLAVAGQIAAAVAHEIRNPLTTIRSSVQYAIESQADWTDKTPVLRRVMNEVDRINRTISGVLGFSRPQALELADVDVRDLVSSALALFEPYLKYHRLTVIRQDAASPLPVRADANQVRQVLMNLLLNACQAMPDGGRLEVATSLAPEEPTPMAVASIRDSGTGIPPEIVARVFDPFFTTKETGTGLGLSISRDIMLRHDGTLDLLSAPGVGTTVRVRLPLRSSDGQHSDR